MALSPTSQDKLSDSRAEAGEKGIEWLSQQGQQSCIFSDRTPA